MNNKKKIKICNLINNLSNIDFLYNYNEFINEFQKLAENNDINYININDFENIFGCNKLNIIKLLYYNRNNIHQILYDKEKIIKIDGDIQNLSFYFYLSLLIKEKEIINYSFSYEYIEKINEKQKNNENIFNKIMFSKIIFDLIDNLKNQEDYDENFNNEIEEKILNENYKIIEDNINNFNKILGLCWDKEYIQNNKIKELYLEIKNALIEKNIIKDFKQIFNIINQLDWENIYNIDEISSIFNKNEKYINDYLISKNEDLYDNTKILFYYNFLENITKKSSIFIYRIKFLLKTRKFIIKLINSKSNIFIYQKTDNIKEVLTKITDSKYYMLKYNKIILNNNKKDTSEDIGTNILNQNNNNLNINEASNNNSSYKSMKIENSLGSQDNNKTPLVQQKTNNNYSNERQQTENKVTEQDDSKNIININSNLTSYYSNSSGNYETDTIIIKLFSRYN